MNDNITIQTGDFRTLGADLGDGSIDLVLTDPPYPKEFLPLWADLGAMAARVLKPSGFLVAYSGAMYLPQVMAMLGEHLSYYWLDGLSHRGAKVKVWARNVLQAMKPILFYQKPPFRKQARRFNGLVESPTQSKKYHKWGQSIEPVKRLLETFSEPGDLVLDPFLGGGTTALAAMLCNRRFIGYELDPETADVARRRIARERLFVAKPGPLQLDFETAGLPRCESCGALLPTNGHAGRKRRYCSDVCRQRACRQRAVFRDKVSEVSQYGTYRARL